MSIQSNQTLLNAAIANTELATANMERAGVLKEQAFLSQQSLNRTKSSADDAYREAKKAQEQAQTAREEAEYYKNLLSKPMATIAANNEAFKETYEKQQELLADWMVSQKAFKELAVKLGVQLGKTKDEIIKIGLSNEEKVLNNETEYGNNASDSNIIKPHIEKLKLKIQFTS